MTTTAYEPALQALLARTFAGEHGPTIAPTLYLALYVDPVRPEDVREFVDRSRQALGASLRFYQTGTMKYPAPISDVKVAQWLDKKLRASQRLEIHTLILNERGIDGVTPSEIGVNIVSRRIEPLSDAERRRDELRRFAKAGGLALLPAGALLLVEFPLDHPIAEPRAFVAWVKELEAATGGCLVYGSAGVALNLAIEVHGEEAVDQHEHAKGLLARHPGLDLLPSFGQRLGFVNADGQMQTRVRRAAWLNLLPDATVVELGGIAHVESALAGTSARIDRLGKSAWIVRACPAPRIGDVSVGDRVPEYVRIGHLLKPVRFPEIAIGTLSHSSEWAERWHSAFDGDGV